MSDNLNGRAPNDTDKPVILSARYQTLDVLRGIAVLAIFAVNIKGMAAPIAYYANASLWAGPYDMMIATFQAFLIDDKWRTIFTGLFGAGIILIAEKTNACGFNPITRLARRNGFLLVFGLIHLLFIWIGDILTTYALTGFAAMAFWRSSLQALWRWVIGLFILSYIWIGLMDVGILLLPEIRNEMKPIMWEPDAAALQEAFDIALSANVITHIEGRINDAIGFIIYYFFLNGHFIETLATMLSGIALWKNGFLKGSFSSHTYLKIALITLSVSILTDSARWTALIITEWKYETFVLGLYSNFFNGLVGGLGFSALVMAAVKSGITLSPIAKVGRMAFSNYIACSLIGTTFTYGHGGGFFGQLNLFQLMGIVFIVWVFLLIFSTLWLSLFRFGPLEWVWRSLSYGKVQPIYKR